MGLAERKYLELGALEGLFSGGAGSDFVRLLFERAPSAIAVFDRDMRYLAASRRWYEDYQLGDQQILGRCHYDVFPDVPDRWKAEHARCLAGETLLCEEDRFERADGSAVYIRWELVPIRPDAGLPLGMIMLTEVITRRVEAEAAREATGKTLEIAEEVAHIGTWDWDLRTEKVMCSPVMCQLLGMGDQATTIRIDDLADFLHPDDAAHVRFGIGEVRSGQDPKPEIITRVIKPDGTTIWLRLAIRAGRDGGGRIQQVYGTIQDITDERLTQQELAFRDRAFDTAASPLAMSTIDAHYTYGNRAFVELLGYASFDEIVGRPFRDFITDPQRVEGSVDTLRETGRWSGELRMVRADGTEFDVAVLAGLVRDEDGEPFRVIFSYLDLAESEKAEARLNQAQKMETVGQLVGGVAHDFNNLLMAIQLNLELANMLVADRPEVSESIAVALNAVDRGAELTRRLLAFSRQQPLAPRVINANELIGNMMKLLHRLLRENIETRTMLEAAAWPIEVDPGQLEAALLNLVVNARDAMPDGGTLRIETANVVLDSADTEQHDDIFPGEHVRITVSDSGTGMAPDVLARAFDPFFTTKEVGKGSGLGLSMVYGFVKQSGGHIAIDSRVGEGTRVMLHFRRAPAAPVVSPAPRPGRETVRPGHETILLVEDDADVRQTVDRLLKSLGYQVIAAPDGPAAVALIVGGLRPDLLLADVVLPRGMSGRDVSEAVAARVPACRILFMSGYTEDAVMHHGRLDEGVVLLSKPFPRELLARKVRELLDG